MYSAISEVDSFSIESGTSTEANSASDQDDVIVTLYGVHKLENAA